MKIAIVGVGAMGSLLGYLLHQSGYSPWLFDTCQERVGVIKRDGLTVEGTSETDHCSLSTITCTPEDIGVADVVIMCVKAYDTEGALKSAQPLIGSDTMVLTLQNGLNNIEKIVDVTGPERVIGGTTSHGATLLRHGYIRYAGGADTVIGPLRGEKVAALSSIKEMLDTSGISTTITDDVEAAIWSKLVVNAAINPLSALTRLKNGELIKCDEVRAIQNRIVDEACKVASAKGVTLFCRDPHGEVVSVCKATASNKSSMLQDIEKGRKTEVEYINGAIVGEGERYHIPTPYNRIVTTLVSAIEVQRDVCMAE